MTDFSAVDQVIHIAASAIGAAVAGWGMTPFIKRHFRWTQRRVDILNDHAQWSHKAIRMIAEHLGLDVDASPLSRPTPPPPLTPDWTEEITSSGAWPGKKKKK